MFIRHIGMHDVCGNAAPLAVLSNSVVYTQDNLVLLVKTWRKNMGVSLFYTPSSQGNDF